MMRVKASQVRKSKTYREHFLKHIAFELLLR